jgi:hypothetical protein
VDAMTVTEAVAIVIATVMTKKVVAQTKAVTIKTVVLVNQAVVQVIKNVASLFAITKIKKKLMIL